MCSPLALAVGGKRSSTSLIAETLLFIHVLDDGICSVLQISNIVTQGILSERTSLWRSFRERSFCYT